MKFFQPQYWLLLAALPVLALFFVWAWRKRMDDRRRFLRGLSLDKVALESSPLKAAAKGVCLLGAVLFATIALARPQWGTHQELVRREGLDVMVAIDVSRSMDVRDESLAGMSRLEKAKLEVARLERRMPGDRLGLVLFDRDAFINCPLTLDHAAFSMYLDVVNAQQMPSGGEGTQISKAVYAALQGFDIKAKQSRILVLFSDGETFDPNPQEAAEAAKSQNVRIYTVGVGSTKGGLIPIADRSGKVVDYVKDEEGRSALSRLQPAVLEQLASATGGKFYLASSGAGVLKSLVEDITGLQKAELEGKLVTQYEDRYQIPLLIALGLLMIEFAISDLKGQSWWKSLVGGKT